MTISDGFEPQTPPDDEALRRKLLARVGIAAAVIAVLVGTLVVFEGRRDKDVIRSPELAAVKPIAPAEAPPAEAKPAPEPEKAAETEKPAESVPSGQRPADAAPERKELPEPPVVAAEPERTEAPRVASGRIARPLTVPATPQQAAVRPSEPVVAAKPELRKEGAKEVARVMPAPRAKEAPAPASQPIARAVESARQFFIQVGAFGNLANAEELRAKLENAGVPAHIEARVQVGPFASRAEAEQAREKMKALGVTTGFIVTRR